MPQLGESVAEGTVTQWHVKVGDVVRREQPLLEVATDKADSVVPCPANGTVVSTAIGRAGLPAPKTSSSTPARWKTPRSGSLKFY